MSAGFDLVPVTCTHGSQTPGQAGTRAQTGTASKDRPPSGKDLCSTTPISAAAAKRKGLAPAPAGKTWAEEFCKNDLATDASQYLLIDAGQGRPQVTPQQLLVQALGELQVPLPTPATAPPPGSEGLVGLPEWFWTPSGRWHPLQLTVRAGPVWATVTATPQTLSFRPSAGMSTVTCTGPGTTYNPDESAADQHTNCSYTFQQDSATQPGGAYDATLSVSWRITWTGSGGAGGLVDPAMVRSTPLTIRVTQAEALVTTP